MLVLLASLQSVEYVSRLRRWVLSGCMIHFMVHSLISRSISDLFSHHALPRNQDEIATKLSNKAELRRSKLSRVPDGVASAQTNPLGDGTVLALSLSKLLLGAEGLVALWY